MDLQSEGREFESHFGQQANIPVHQSLRMVESVSSPSSPHHILSVVDSVSSPSPSFLLSLSVVDSVSSLSPSVLLSLSVVDSVSSLSRSFLQSPQCSRLSV